MSVLAVTRDDGRYHDLGAVEQHASGRVDGLGDDAELQPLRVGVDRRLAPRNRWQHLTG